MKPNEVDTSRAAVLSLIGRSSFEEMAQEFMRQTGYLAPGKDGAPPEDQPDRRELMEEWKSFAAYWNRLRRQRLEAAVGALLDERDEARARVRELEEAANRLLETLPEPLEGSAADDVRKVLSDD